jgi:hypothetical protein
MGLIYEKTEGRKSRTTVPLTETDMTSVALFYTDLQKLEIT